MGKAHSVARGQAAAKLWLRLIWPGVRASPRGRGRTPQKRKTTCRMSDANGREGASRMASKI